MVGYGPMMGNSGRPMGGPPGDLRSMLGGTPARPQRPQRPQPPRMFDRHPGGGFQMHGDFMPSVLSRLTGEHSDAFKGIHPGLMADALSGMTGVPHFAMGGVVTQPTLAMVGENGPEAITPLHGGFGGGPFGAAQSLTQRAGAPATAPGAPAAAAGANPLLQPGGDPRIMALLRRHALANYDANQRSSSVLSRLYGLDPMQQRGAIVNSEIGGRQGLADSLNTAALGQATGQENFLQRLYMQQQEQENQRRIAKEQAKAQSSGGWGSLAGGLAGSFLGPIGTAAGSAIGGKIK